ncbi:glutamate receptor ionotropic, NMDA 3A-like isoform X2 [Sitodiplosis mosellana]|uniref:glutamate receptor ionotropic, NMDA 3A-like isoform X2 n=1 Tax=Sitodiplosis mosellana TaxID=263140 RepID=UPI002444B510|nr:glutamate receptor ionotropic, NMDA 3A-like isoform X2 [Sitodiplosis mosellana]
MREATKLALSGRPIYNGVSEQALTTNFELLNLVPSDHPYHLKISDNQLFQSKSSSTTTASFTAHHKAKRSTSTTTTTTTKGANVISTPRWRRVGLVSASSVQLDTIVWPGGDIVVSGLSAGARTVFRIVTALAPPFVMESELDEDGLCLRGLPCHRVSPVGRHNLTLMFNAIETRDRLEEDAVEHGNDLPPKPEQLDEKISHDTKCCYGLTMDLLDNIATELGFEFHLYVVRDQLFGSRQQRDVKDFIKSKSAQHSSNNDGINSSSSSSTSNKPTTSSSLDHDVDDETSNNDQWNGIIGDLVSGSADMSFAPLSVSKARAQAIDFSIPYFHSGVSLLASPKRKSEIPLLAFLLPFSPELWIAIFTSLNITAVAVAVYEWLSPFGLNPWGRQRSKNFSLSSALWVMWGLLCGHLVAFKAPKSWPNKFLINVWGGFSVIFVASYTANIAALIAGLFFHHAASSYDSSLTTQKVGAPIASAAESYVQNKDKHLWEHMKKYSLNHIEDGIRGLKNGTLDLLMADSPILDYYRATDHGCSLQRIGETFVEDTYAIGMVKGFPLRESISALIAKYSTNGYLDILTEKWYGGLPCFKYEAEIVTPRPLGVAAVAGVFLLLGLGMVMGVVILIFEHWFYKYALPSLRLKPKGTIWKSRNIMFFSQKLYRFINCVELVSPHHAARELVHSIRQGQIASLFQKSIKREDEQRRRRKSKAQFFEMIQEIRRAQQVERQNLAAVTEVESQKDHIKSPPLLFKPRASPKPSIFSALKKDGRSRSNSSVLTPRRFSTDSILGDRMDSIGRRLSRDLTNSPPDLNRRYEFGKNDLSPNKYDTISGSNLSASNLAALGISKSNEALSGRYDTFSGKNVEKSSILAVKLKKPGKRPKISFDSYHRDRSDSGRDDCDDELPPVKEGLEPSFLQQDRSAAVLRQKLHQELRAKHPPVQTRPTVTIVENTPNSVDRPPLPKKFIVRHQRQKSLDNLDVDSDTSSKLKTSPYQSDSSAGSLTRANQRSQISLERLSREDLLRLSQSSQSEIHEYLKNSSLPDRTAEPP